MSKIVAFLAECQGSATIDEQRAAMKPETYLVVAGDQSLNKLADLLARAGLRLEAGDRVAIYDLSCIKLSTGTLIRLIRRMLKDGVAFEIVSAGIIIQPDPNDKLHVLVRALDHHQRLLHALKTRPAEASRGRKPLLDPAHLPTIRGKLEQPGATASSVAKELGVSRSTLFNFLERHGRNRKQEQEGRKAE